MSLAAGTLDFTMFLDSSAGAVLDDQDIVYPVHATWPMGFAFSFMVAQS